MELFDYITVWLNDFLLNMGMWAFILSSLFIVAESFLAFLPLFVFITINFLTLGPVIGGLLSWICTVLGCYLTFYAFRKSLSKWFDKKIRKKKKVIKFMKALNKIRFSQLVLIMAIPFTPSFFVNLAAGLSHINKKKYLWALIISKIFIVYFWGFVGSSLIECLTNPYALLKIIMMLLVAYLLSFIINKKFDLDERF